MTKKILVVEDNEDIARLIKINLSSSHMQVDHVADGDGGLQQALSGKHHLVILDLMLPGMDGMDICRVMRRNKIYTPVLMLTAKTAETDRVAGLEVGADDYLTKPFSVPELVARVHAMLRRTDEYLSADNALAGQQINTGALSLQADKRRVTKADEEIELTAREFDLLWHFATHPGRVFTRAQLLDKVWGYGHEGYEHTVNSHINRLRAKLEDNPAEPCYVLTVWGVGYKFAEQLQAAKQS